MWEENVPLWQEENGVRFHRFRCCNTPYNSVRPRPTRDVVEMMKAAEEKKKRLHPGGITLSDQLRWIEKGEKTYKLSCLDTSSIPKEIREGLVR